ncbi:hypothetical protein [Flagellimonas myxillae]|uniref:hypothetical protein n=1 Tax=Flagellimonas myxillae TaxID=2942214 RepID=UPI00201FA0CC|nr:hypothetical protein [Muricauda myxillae]MCL6265075.1 hypothetical protein [Muricauda myxillae]
MKKSSTLRIGIKVIILSLLMLGCTSLLQDEETDVTDSNSEIESNFLVMTNATDPLIATYMDNDYQVDFWGDRDDNGMPTNINQFDVIDQGDTTIYRLDNIGRPLDIFTQDGTQINFVWHSELKASVTFLSDDGSSQLNTEVDFTKDNFEDKVLNVNKSSRRKITSRIPFINNPNKPIDETKVNISVFQCGVEKDARVRVIVKSEAGLVLGTFPTKRLSSGRYTSSIPSSIAPKINLKDICQSASTALGNVCLANKVNSNLFPKLCLATTAALVESVVGAPVAAKFLAACATAVAGLNVVCIATGSPAPGAPNLKQKLCNSDFLDREYKEDIFVGASALALPNNVLSSFEKVNEGGLLPKLNINFNSQTTIRSLRLSPSSPVAGQDYFAIADIFCLYQGTVGSISVAGSDGYSDQITFSSNSTSLQPQALGEYSLSIPGAESGVRDVVTLIVNLPDGQRVSRTASLIFN